MKLIKAAQIYRISLPAADALRGHLQEVTHRDIGTLEAGHAGVVPGIEGDLVTTFYTGLAFSVQIDRKVLPGAAVNAEVAKRVAKIEEAEARKVGRKERRELKDAVHTEMLATSHVTSKVITSFYHPDSRLLIVPAGSKKDADIITSLLIRAVGAAKTETIHVNDLKGGLTTRLRKLIGGDDTAFGSFEVEPQAWLKRDSEKVTYQIDNIDAGQEGLTEALDANFQVDAVRLGFGVVSFKLASDFTFKGVKFCDNEDGTASDNAIDEWMREAAYQVFAMVKAIEALCTLFDYQAPAEEVAE